MSVGDDAGADFEDGNAVGASRIANKPAAIDKAALLTQYSPRFTETMSADTEVDEDDGGGEGGIGAAPLELIAGDGLRQEVRPLQVRAQHLVEAVLGGLQEIHARARRPSGVVHERIGHTDRRAQLCDQASAILGLRQIAAEVMDLDAQRAQFAECGRRVRLRPSAAKRKHPPFARQRARDAQADAAGSAGNEDTLHEVADPKKVRYGKPSASRFT
jgi:hypothetical protein